MASDEEKKPEAEEVVENHENGNETEIEIDNIVRVRGLPWSATEEEIRKFFEACENIVNVHFTFSREGRPSGEAYLELGSTKDVELALLKHKEHMGHRYIEVFQSKKAEMEYVLRRSGTAGAVEADDHIVRLRGLPFGCTKEEIANFFAGLAVVPDGICMPTDGQGRLTGEAFVRFADADAVDRALEKHMQCIGHRYIEVFRSGGDEMERAQRRLGGFGGRRDRPGPYDPPAPAPRARRRPDEWGAAPTADYGPRPWNPYWTPQGPPAPAWTPRYGRYPDPTATAGAQAGYAWGTYTEPAREGHYVHMRGLPYRAKEADIIKFFDPLRVMDVRIAYEDRTGRPTGEADVEFYTHEDAVEAMKHDKQNMQHRYIELFLNSTPDSKMKAEGQQIPSLIQYPMYGAPAPSWANWAAEAPKPPTLQPPVQPPPPPMNGRN